MQTNVIKFPLHRVRRTDPVSLFVQFYQDQAALAAASLMDSMNVLRLMYDLPPLEAKGRRK